MSVFAFRANYSSIITTDRHVLLQRQQYTLLSYQLLLCISNGLFYSLTHLNFAVLRATNPIDLIELTTGITINACMVKLTEVPAADPAKDIAEELAAETIQANFRSVIYVCIYVL